MSYLDDVNKNWLLRMEKSVVNSLYITRQNDKRDRIYPSDNICPRSIFLESRHEYTSEMLPFVTYAAQIGICTEDMVIDKLNEHHPGYIRAVDVHVTPTELDLGLNYSGKIDIVFGDDVGFILADVKTYGSKLRLPKYSDQIAFYSAVTGIKRAALLAFSRNLITSGRFAFDVIEVDVAKLRQSVVYRSFYAQLCKENDVVPERPKSFRKTIECKYCNFKDECWDGKNTEPVYGHETDKSLLLKLKEQAKELSISFFENDEERLDRFTKLIS